MFFIRQNATHKVVLGPAVAVGDGFTPVTNLAVSTADDAEAILHDNGTVVDISAYTWAAITTADGYYHLTLQSGISGTVGHLTIVVNDDSLILPLRADFTVLEEGIYDSLFAASAAGFDTNQRVNVGQWLGQAVTLSTGNKPDVNIDEISDDATAAGNLELACDNYSVTRGLTGTALPAAVADAAGGLPISDAGGLDMDAMSGITLSGTAGGGSATTIVLTGGVATDGYYDGQLVKINSGPGVGQSRTILSYVAAGTVATVTRDWATNPTAASVFSVHASDMPAILEAGTAQAGANDSITLDAGASAISATYTGNFVMITAGTGIGQTRIISGYDGGTKIASVTPNWTTNPVAGSVYQLIPMGRVDLGRIQSVTSSVTNLKSACDNYSVTRGLTGTALPAAAAAAAGGIPLSTNGSLEMDTLADWVDAGRLDAILDTIAGDTTTDIPALIATAQADLDTITGTGGVLIGTDVMDRSGTLDVNAKTITNGAIVAATLGADCITEAKIANNAIAAEHVAASALNGKGDWNTVVPDAAGVAPTAIEIRTEIDTNSTQLSAIVDDTDLIDDGTSGLAKIASDVAAVLVDTAVIGTAVNLGGGATIADNLDDIAGPDFSVGTGATDDSLRGISEGVAANAATLGAAGAGLSAIPWNSDWDAEVESEVNDALDTAISELGVAAPTSTPTIHTGLMLLYMALRNQLKVQTSGTDALEIYNNAGTLICKKLLAYRLWKCLRR
jgi:hypothetical protein